LAMLTLVVGAFAAVPAAAVDVGFGCVLDDVGQVALVRCRPA